MTMILSILVIVPVVVHVVVLATGAGRAHVRAARQVAILVVGGHVLPASCTMLLLLLVVLTTVAITTV